MSQIPNHLIDDFRDTVRRLIRRALDEFARQEFIPLLVPKYVAQIYLQPQNRGYLASRSQSGHPHEIRLQIVDPRFGGTVDKLIEAATVIELERCA